MSATNPGGISPELSVDVASDLLGTTVIKTNLGQEVHVTTRDKVELALRRTIPKYTSTEQVLASVGVFLAFAVALVSSDFKKTWLITADMWTGLFLAGALASGVWMCREIVRWLKRPSIAEVVNEVLATSEKVGDPPGA